MADRKWLRKQPSIARKIAQESSTASKQSVSPALIQRALEDPTPDNLTPEVIASLQQSHGNAFVSQLTGADSKVSGGLAHPIQAKLTVTPAGDKYEQEADQVASQVVQSINNGGQADTAQRADEEELQMKRIDRQEEEEEPIQMKRIDRQEEEELQMKRIDRQGEEEELQMKRIDRQEEEELQMKRIDRQGEEEELQMKRIDRQEEEELQMKRIDRQEEEEELQMKRIDRSEDPAAGMAVSSDIEDAIQQKSGGGNPLPDTVKGPMENAMGTDFSNVRVHTDDESDALNKSVSAKAFTTGSDIFFGKDQFKPDSSDGQELLAHELTHVVQQTGAQRKEKDE